jgi:hypothetical protein
VTLFAQVAAAWETGGPVTWPRLVFGLSGGLVGGWLAWGTQFRFRWWLLANFCLAVLVLRWHVFVGGEPLYKSEWVEALGGVWLLGGAAGGALYAQSLAWRTPWESHEGGVWLWAWAGVYVGPVLLLWGLVCAVQRLAARHDARLVRAWRRLADLNAERAAVVRFLLQQAWEARQRAPQPPAEQRAFTRPLVAYNGDSSPLSAPGT